MSDETCAACDCRLDSGRISVSIDGKSVEVCSEECARSLREAYISTLGEEAGS